MADDLDDIPRNTNHSTTNRSNSPHDSSSAHNHQSHLYRRLTLLSFSHRRGPLRAPFVPTPGLSFDIRTLPNPPKRVRDHYVGTDKPFRKAFLEDTDVRDRVDGIYRAVRVVLDQYPEDGPKDVEMREAAVENNDNRDDEEDEEDDDDDEEPIPEPQTHIIVGICCEIGRHRSVACVEELARMEWPGGWEIEVVHRDLTRPRSEKDKEKRSRKVERRDDSD